MKCEASRLNGFKRWQTKEKVMTTYALIKDIERWMKHRDAYDLDNGTLKQIVKKLKKLHEIEQTQDAFIVNERKMDGWKV